MKAIYINRYQSPEKKKYRLYFKFLIVVLLLGGVARMMVPYLLTEYINKIGKEESGIRFIVDELSLKILDSKASIGKLRISNLDGSVILMELTDGLIDVDPIRLIKKEYLASHHWKSGEVILSKYLVEGLHAVKNKKKVDRDIYFDTFKITFDEFNIRQVSDENIKTILSLRDTQLKLQNIGFGDSKEQTNFEFDSKIKQGGHIYITGKTLLDHPLTPWDISGKMNKINADVLEKLAGKPLPLDIRDADLNAEIKASSKGGVIVGMIIPDIKEFRLKDESGNTFKRTVAKISNFVFEKMKGKNKELKFEIPFTLKENFTLDIDQTLKKILSQ